MPPALDHVAIAVPSIRAALPLFERISGCPASDRERVGSQGVEVVFLGEAPARLELIQPLDAASSVARFLARRGPGLHHIAYRVPDLDGTLAELREAGIRLIDTEARAGAHGHRVAFLHPASTGGALIELVEY